MSYKMEMFSFLSVFLILSGANGYIEMVDEFGCQDTEFRLTCRDLDTHIAILEANFFPEDPDVVSNTTSSCASLQNITSMEYNITVDYNETTTSINKDYSAKNIRLPLNRRCSGVNHCSFLLPMDTPGAREWGAGLVIFKYVCVAAHRVTKYCNRQVLLNNTLSEGFIQTPGYPRFYVGDINCNWRLMAPEGQLIQIMLLDVSLRINYTQAESYCVDQLTILENNRSIFNSCEEEPTIKTLLSTTSILDINLEITTKQMFPKRGILLYFKGIGCPTIPAPLDGYLLFRNNNIAEYLCNVGFVFPDTLNRSRVLNCVGGNSWHSELPDCINSTYFVTARSVGENIKYNKMPVELDTMSEVVIPFSIIVGMFVINAIVVYYIYKRKKSNLLLHRSSEEQLPLE